MSNQSTSFRITQEYGAGMKVINITKINFQKKINI